MRAKHTPVGVSLDEGGDETHTSGVSLDEGEGETHIMFITTIMSVLNMFLSVSSKISFLETYRTHGITYLFIWVTKSKSIPIYIDTHRGMYMYEL